MIGAIVKLMVRVGVPGRFAGAAAWVATFVALVALIAGARAIYDRRVIARHDAGITAVIAPKVRAADDTAATTRRSDDARTATELKSLEKVIDHAPATPISDARRAYYDCVRLQQVARASGDPAPACD